MKNWQVPERLQSRKFWIALVTTVVMLINALTPIELDLAEVLGVVVPAGLYLLGQSYVDARQAPPRRRDGERSDEG